MKDSFQNRLIEALRESGMRQSDLSRKTGIEKASISMYASGQRKPGYDYISKIAKALNVSEPWLLGYEVAATVMKQKYIVRINISGALTEVHISAVSKDEAAGSVLRLIPTATYNNILEIKREEAHE